MHPGALKFHVRDKVFIAPSGVQKERILPEHIFVLPYPQAKPDPDTGRIFLRRPKVNLKESACTPLFWNAFELRDAGSCIHTHSQHAVMATLLWPGDVFSVSHLEVRWIEILLDQMTETRVAVPLDDQRREGRRVWSGDVIFRYP